MGVLQTAEALTKPLQHVSLASVAGTRCTIRGTEKVKPGSHYVAKIAQKEPKDKDSEFESIVFWVFLHDSVNQALGKSFVCMEYISYFIFSYFKHIYTGYKFNKDIVLQFGPVKIKVPNKLFKNKLIDKNIHIWRQ